jgi:cobalt-zinc-cadmium efflux system outer membrane protein
MLHRAVAWALGFALALHASSPALAQVPNRAPSRTLTLTAAMQRALAANPRLTAAERDIGIARGRRIQAGAIPNPDLSFELDNAFGTGDYRGTRSAETTLQISQLVELSGKRQARIAAGDAGFAVAGWDRAAVRLEVLSETAIAFVNVLSAQRRVEIFDEQIATLGRLTPLLQRRVDAGASSPAEIARAEVAADLAKADRERARVALAVARRDLAALMGLTAPDFKGVSGNLSRIGRPPPFPTVLAALEANPQLVRWTAVQAQRRAELLLARLKVVPDPQVGLAWRHYRDTGDDAVRLGVAIPLPLWDQNRGGILEAQETLAKTDAEWKINRIGLILLLGRAWETIGGAIEEVRLLRGSTIPKSRNALETIEGGYGQGRFTLLEILDAQAVAVQAALREVEALTIFHTAVATIEGLTGSPLTLSREASR